MIINKMKLENKVNNLNLINLFENKIIKIAEIFINKNAALSPLKKIKTSDKIKTNINNKKNLSFFFYKKNR